MRSNRMAAVGAVCAALLVVSACGSDDEDDGGTSASGGGGGGSSAGGPLRIGLLTEITGPAAAQKGDRAQTGFNARLAVNRDEGGACADTEVELVVADTASNPQGALTAAQRLVQQEDVYAILGDSQLFFAAVDYLTTQAADMPVIGPATDGSPQWLENDGNLFPASPPPLPDVVFTTTGEFLAEQGVTTVAGVAMATPSSQTSLETILRSADAAGLDRGYVNNSMPLGSEDVGAMVLGIQDSGSNGLYLPITTSSAVAIMQGLSQADYPFEAAILASGYGGSTLENQPFVDAAQGASFSLSYSPVQIEGEATDRMRQAMEAAGVPGGIPDLGQSQGWMMADLLLHGLEVAGCDATQEEFMAALDDDATWDAGGLYSRPFDFSDHRDLGQECGWFVTLEGEEFVPVSDEPICGEEA
ncbi:ABC transporter substrate-binding protein [Trujillonella endophytica]|uniref:Branched-chain amino acid transport system substrate-binding protein n=1 Tax=Trujillonella endophytica TaxID=673521 RepID=A0A1H8QMG1_9ACTN|nr:ABC transporter substrate-binding protein [Trujillella endophytica]SEO55003.1 branched-chain amino acid transport system substrate-binding protein [Trujillella endophytica]